MSKFFDFRLSELEPYAPGEQPKGVNGLIKLNTNESPFPPSPKAVMAVAESSVKDLRLYPDPSCSGFIGAVAEQYGVSPSQVTAGNGSDELLAFCFHGFCPGGAIFADITYGFYPVFSKMFGVAEQVVPLREDFSIAPEDYKSKTGTVFIANPNAPTGLSLPLPEIREILEQDRDRLVIVDEAYVDFGGESALPLVSEYNNLLIIRTLSKSRQLAGIRLAFAVGSEELIAELNTLKFSFNPYSVNRIALAVGEAAMHDTEYFEKCRAAVISNREYATKALRGLGFTVLESRANFIFACPLSLSARQYYLELRERGILVRYFDKDRIRDFVRISIGSEEDMRALVIATGEIIGALQTYRGH